MLYVHVYKTIQVTMVTSTGAGHIQADLLHSALSHMLVISIDHILVLI